MVVEEGTIELMIAGDKVVAKSRYMIVWKRINGVLKIFRDSSASDPK